ncbi:iron-sulfur cluster assembly accessory protein [Halioxenophilus sp. WMMB6]|uniref:HesB/IscA family protein n=1 Tax=Halioxenophilus sp. WMMB6 TaxID=3073815 RepID=UPI00295F1677|nr:iron-sulfur cluster assembly accessory protein [Halioxenophilus sp. WMMB6]
MSVSTFDPNAQAVTVTEKALRYFHRNANQHSGGDNHWIRLSVTTSGCSGYAYVLDFVEQPDEGDQIIALDDQLSLALDSEAVTVLRGTEIDLVTEGLNQVIKFNNPNVVGQCGCGESFSVN